MAADSKKKAKKKKRREKRKAKPNRFVDTNLDYVTLS